MQKIKLANVKEILLKRDEKFLFKYKNLTIVSVAMLIVLFAIVLLLPSNKAAPKEQDVSTTTENNLISIENEKDGSIATDKTSDTTVQQVVVDPINSDKTPEFKVPNLTTNNVTPASDSNSNLQNSTEENSINVNSAQSNEVEKSDNVADENLNTQKPETKVITMYCDSFSTENDAMQKKATIAFSTGLLSEVVNKNGTYQLKLGPFNTRNKAIEAFKKLDSQELVGECTLENVN